jgi:hypothetical protein
MVRDERGQFLLSVGFRRIPATANLLTVLTGTGHVNHERPRIPFDMTVDAAVLFGCNLAEPLRSAYVATSLN